MTKGLKSDNLEKLKQTYNIPEFITLDLYSFLDIELQIKIIIKNNDTDRIYDQVFKLITDMFEDKEIKLPFSSDFYSVRSSCSIEDGKKSSMAGIFQSFIKVKASELKSKIKEVFLSLYKKDTLNFILKNNDTDIKDIKMYVIIQKMIDPDYSGISFNINPATGNDSETVIEIVKGTGMELAGGLITPERYIYNYFEESFTNEDFPQKEMIRKIADTTLEIGVFFGYPVDIEFLVKGDIVYIIQARPITKISFIYNSHYTSANFKDGGVSSELSVPLMASLYKYTFDKSLKDFLLETKALKPDELHDELIIFGSRCYWNVSDCKSAQLKMPGFIEREYDLELGIPVSYEGKGKVSASGILFYFNALKIALSCLKIFKKNRASYPSKKENLLSVYNSLNEINLESAEDGCFYKKYKELITEHYFKTECAYFNQVFVNIEKVSLFRKKAYRYLNRSEYLRLLSNMHNLSHFRLKYELKTIADKININPEIKYYYLNINSGDIYSEDIYYNKEIISLNRKYGYLSNKVLDISYESFDENIMYLLDILKTVIKNIPQKKNEIIGLSYEDVKNKISRRAYNRLLKKAFEIKEFLLRREELKDISTRFYYLIRKYSLSLENRMIKRNIIKKGDIFFVDYKTIIDYLDNKISVNTLTDTIRKQKMYYNSFKNFDPVEEIGLKSGNEKTTDSGFKGVPASGGIAKGKAKVLSSLLDFNQIDEGDIIIVKYLEVGLAPYMYKVAGIVSETGGILCHTSIIARELGIPAVISLASATKLIKTDDIITIDGFNGKVEKEN